MKPNRNILKAGVRSRAVAALLLASLVASLGGCGGHSHKEAASSGTPGTPVPDPVPATPGTTIVTMRVIDGPIQGATVFQDLNGNDEFDEGEPSGISDASGNAQVTVKQADLGKDIPWVALVPAGAVDADSGLVEVAYKLGSPNESSGVISPTSSLVQIFREVFGKDIPTATEEIRDIFEAYGIKADPLADFTKTDDETSRTIASIAQVLVLIKQELIRPTGMRAGYADVIDNTVLGLFGQAVALAASPEITAISDPKLRLFVLRIRAVEIAAGAGLSGENIANVIDAYRSAQGPAPAPELPTRSLRYVRYNSAEDYDFSVFQQTAAQKMPDANGLLYFSETRRRAVTPGGVQIWGQAYQRDRLVFDGTSWNDCPEDFISNMTPVDGEDSFDLTYCQNYRYHIRKSFETDVGGMPYRTLLDLLAGGLEKPAEPSYWPEGVIPTGAVLPKGARVSVQFRTPVNPPDSYSPVDLPNVLPFGTLCTTAAAGAAFTLEDLLQLSGVQCSFGPHAGSWDYALLRLTPGQEGRTADSISASFMREAGNNVVVYWRCDAGNNCNPTSTGNFSIDTVGDARILHLSGQPAEVAGRSFVQRGNFVYYGERQEARETVVLLPNQIATDALLSALGL